MATHAVPVHTQYAQHPILHRIVDTYGRTPAPPAPSTILFSNGLPVGYFTDDQLALILAEYIERNGSARA